MITRQRSHIDVFSAHRTENVFLVCKEIFNPRKARCMQLMKLNNVFAIIYDKRKFTRG